MNRPAPFMPWRRLMPWLRRLLLFLIATPVLLALLLGALLLGANSQVGRDLIEGAVEPLSGGLVRIQGLEGQLPLAPRLARLELRDADGPWLTLNQLALDLDPWPLLRGRIDLPALSARMLSLERLPASTAAGEDTQGQSAPPWLPPLALRHLAVQRLTLGTLIPGAPSLQIEGDGTLTSLTDFAARLEVQVPQRPDTYRLTLAASGAYLDLQAAIHEDPQGLISLLLRSLEVRLPPEVDRWQLQAQAKGPLGALDLRTDLAAGPLQVTAQGQLDLLTQSAQQLDLEARLPAMSLTPAPDLHLAWQDVRLEAKLHGPWQAPRGQAELEATGLALEDAGLSRLTARLEGDPHRLRLTAAAERLQVAAAPANLAPVLADHPLQVSAELRPEESGGPFEIDLSHPLLHLSAEGQLADLSAHWSLALPDLALLARDWSGRFQAEGDVRGPVGEPGGGLAVEPAEGLAESPVGRWAEGPVGEPVGGPADGPAESPVERLAEGTMGGLIGVPVKGPAEGQVQGPVTRPDPGTEAPAAAPDLRARLTLDAHHARLGTARVGGDLSVDLRAPQAGLRLKGDWGDQPLALNLSLRRDPDGSLAGQLDPGQLGRIQASGQWRLAPGARLPVGDLQVVAEGLEDLEPLVGQPMAGHLKLDLRLTPEAAQVSAQGRGLRLPGQLGIAELDLRGQVADLLALTGIDGRVQIRGLDLPQVTGELTLSAQGQGSALDLNATASLTTPLGPGRLAAAAGLDLPGAKLALSHWETQLNGETLRLLGSANLDFQEGLAVDRLRLGLGSGSLDLSGRLLPALDLDGRLDQLSLAQLGALAGHRLAEGQLAAQASLQGSLEAPTGSLKLQASQLQLVADGGYGLPPARIDAELTLKPGANALTARAQLGPQGDLNLRGQIGGQLPLAAGALALKAEGRLDLGLLDPLLTAGGRQALGQANLNAGISGTLQAPRLEGRLRLAGVGYRDWNLGLGFTDIAGDLVLDGSRLRLEGVRGQAGTGRLSLSGDVGLLEPGLPLNLSLSARGAEPLRFDWLHLKGDADITLRGPATAATLAGEAHFDRIDIRLPDHVAARVPTLAVREEGQPRQPLPPTQAEGEGGPPFQMALDLSLQARRGVYVRGQGVDAELGGKLNLAGNLDEPEITGGFELIRGTYVLVGQTLTFSRGRIALDGATGLDPTLNLEARVTAAGNTAILGVEGTASAPRIVLSGEPPLPQDEVLSRLLFGVAGTRLSPWQAAQVGLAAARLAGIGPKGPGLLEQARTALGLDRLSIGTDAEGATTAEAGRQLSERVYLGARQGTRAGETQGVMRIEISPNLRLETDIGTTNSSRVGIAYEKEY